MASFKLCASTIRLSRQSVRYLREAIQKPKEEFGELMVSSDTIRKGYYTLELQRNVKQAKRGRRSTFRNSSSGSQHVTITTPHPVHYSYHTHPLKAYKEQGVRWGWPSSSDFQSLNRMKGVIVHLVVTREGIYFVVKYSRNRSVPKKFIFENFTHPLRNTKMTPEEVVNRVNRVRYQRKPVFNVTLVKWTNAWRRDVYIQYTSTNQDGCKLKRHNPT